MYRGDVNRGLVRGLCKKNVCMTQGINEDYIGLKPKVYSSILKNLYSKTKNLNGNFNSILSINRQVNKETELDIKTVPITLHQLHTE